MADGKEYKITVEHVIHDEGGASASPPTSSPPSENANGKTKPKAVGKVTDSLAKVAGVQTAKAVAQYAVSNYGTLTGDFVGQEAINAGVEVAGYVATIAVGGAVGAVTVALQIASKGVNYIIERAKKDQQAEILRERTGTNVSRGR